MSDTPRDLLVIQPQLPIGSLEAYIQRINDISILTLEQEQYLATQFQAHGDLKAAQQLVLAHLRYVAHVSRGYLGYGLPLGDLIQEGTVGLMKAVKRFDPKIGVRLVSFAVHWIKAEIHEYILRNWRIVKVATTKAQRKLFFNLRSAKKRLGWSTQKEVETIASELGVSQAEVQRMEERLNARDVGFDLPAANADREGSRTGVSPEYLEDRAANPAIQLEAENWDASTGGQLKIAFEQLDPRSQVILEKRWLCDNKETLQTLAEIYQVSTERIRQIESNALKKLKQLMIAA